MYETLGAVTHIIPPKGYHVEYSNGIATLVSDTPAAPLMDSVTKWATDRSKETSTKVGVIAGGAMAPTIIDNVGKSVMFGLAGDYVSCAMYGVPAILGIVGSVGAIFKPDPKSKGLSDDEIKNLVDGATREQLIGMLSGNANPSTPIWPQSGLRQAVVDPTNGTGVTNNGTIAAVSNN